jgi:hypothetical protein
MVLVVGGTNSAIRQVIAPLVTKFYVVTNNTSGGYAITIGASTGSIITVPNGTTVQVYCDGTNFYSAQTSSAGDFLVNGNLTAAGIADTGILTATSVTAGSLSVTGTAAFSVSPTAPTPSPGDNTTKVATTAFVTAATSGLGTMATQNATAVAITGGTISNVTVTNISIASVAAPVTVAQGGTGSTSLTANNVILGNGTSAVQTVAPGTSGNSLVSNGTTWVSGTPTIKGLGFGGETWHNVTGSRSSGTQYTNSNGYPIAVSAKGTGASSPSIDVYVNGVYVQGFNWQFNGAGAHSGCFTIVPTGATYQLNFNGSGIDTWAELY